MVDEGKCIGDIAARFGVSETIVHRRLALARLSPALWTAYEAAEMTLEVLQAFTLTADHATQERVWNELREWDRDNPGVVRCILLKEEIPATDKRVRFVGLDSYEAVSSRTSPWPLSFMPSFSANSLSTFASTVHAVVCKFKPPNRTWPKPRTPKPCNSLVSSRPPGSSACPRPPWPSGSGVCLLPQTLFSLSLLAFCSALSLNAVQRKNDTDAERIYHADALATALQIDMRNWFTPTAANFFSKVSKTRIFDAMSEAGKADDARSAANFKKGPLAEFAETTLTGTGWLPEPIRIAPERPKTPPSPASTTKTRR
jgi:hypothetical protein